MIDDDSDAPKDSDPSREGRTQTREKRHERPVVLITGDSLGLPLELGRLLRDCGCSAFVTTDLTALQVTTYADLAVIMVNFASVETADPDKVRVLREQYDKPIVCLLPYPPEQYVSRVISLRADHIMFKPLCTKEFEYRIRLLLAEQRPPGIDPTAGCGRRGQGPAFQFSEREKVIARDGRQFRLTRKGHALMRLLASDPGRVFSVDEIVAAVWAGRERATAADVHQCIYALRKRIEEDPGNPRYIITVPSFGYRFAGSVEA